MRNQTNVARPAARKDTSGGRARKTVAVASTRKSEPMIQLVERKSAPLISHLLKKTGALPAPICTFTF